MECPAIQVSMEMAGEVAGEEVLPSIKELTVSPHLAQQVGVVVEEAKVAKEDWVVKVEDQFLASF